MNLISLFGAVLLALLISAMPALVHPQHWKVLRGDARLLLRRPFLFLADLFGSEVGTVSVTYCTPILGTPSTTAPTAAQAAQVVKQMAQVSFLDTDAVATITHNWGAAGKITNSSPGWLLPIVMFNKSLGGASDSSFATEFTFGLTNTNSVTMTKIGLGTGQGGTFNVYLRIPYPSVML